jgi:nucleoside-diphosphate-sugar epimerase
MARILVTGAFGFLGRPLAAKLADAGHEIVALDNGFRGDAQLLAEGRSIERITGDVRDAELVRRAASGCDAIAHLAAVQGTANFYRMPSHVLDVNVRGMFSVLDAAVAEGVGRVLFTSSSEVYGVPTVFPTPEEAPLVVPEATNPRWSYGGSKIIGELMLVNRAREEGFEYTVVRPHNVYGPAMGWDHVIPEFIRRLERGEEFTVQGDGSQRRSFCYVDDAVDVLVAALGPGGANETFNIGNPTEEYSIADLIRLLSEVSGKPIEPRHMPFAGGGTTRRLPDVTRATEQLGFSPSVSLSEGLRRTYDWYSAELRNDAERGGKG